MRLAMLLHVQVYDSTMWAAGNLLSAASRVFSMHLARCCMRSRASSSAVLQHNGCCELHLKVFVRNAFVHASACAATSPC
jgi:hypothetical protein